MNYKVIPLNLWLSKFHTTLQSLLGTVKAKGLKSGASSKQEINSMEKHYVSTKNTLPLSKLEKKCFKFRHLSYQRII